MEKKPTGKPCREWDAWVAQGLDEAGGGSRTRSVAHLETCTVCARSASEMEMVRQELKALPARATSAEFEARLMERLAAVDSQRQHSWWLRWASARDFRPRRVMAFAAVMLAAAGAAFFTHLPPAPMATRPPAQFSDNVLVMHCVEQHRTEDAAQPLSDIAAQNLAAHADGPPGTDAAIAASEDGL